MGQIRDRFSWPSPCNWITTIHWNVVLTVLHTPWDMWSTWETVRTTLKCINVFQSWHQCFSNHSLRGVELAYCTSSHLKSFLEPAVPPIRLFIMINLMPLKRCVMKGKYFTALLRNKARNKFRMSGPRLSVAKLRPLSFAAARWRCLYLLL